eukprot:1157654-Pelagomonas_calceolata.AAC.12
MKTCGLGATRGVQKCSTGCSEGCSTGLLCLTLLPAEGLELSPGTPVFQGALTAYVDFVFFSFHEGSENAPSGVPTSIEERESRWLKEQ